MAQNRGLFIVVFNKMYICTLYNENHKIHLFHVSNFRLNLKKCLTYCSEINILFVDILLSCKQGQKFCMSKVSSNILSS